MIQTTMEHANTRTFTVKGSTFTSTMTDQQCYNRMVEIGRGEGFGRSQQFARDLATAYNRYRSWTDRQRPWAHKLVLDHQNRNKPKPTLTGFLNIYQHLQNCRKRRDEGGTGLLKPMVAIGNGDPQILHGVQFVMKWTGPRSKRPNHIAVSECAGYGQGKFYGYIDEQGQFEQYSACPDLVVQYLRRIAQDPAREISALGRESGLCCYCRSGLTQVQSKIAGCGSTCARKYDVWYPNAAETRDFIQETPQVLTGASDADRWI
jgi:hypothetical protein